MWAWSGTGVRGYDDVIVGELTHRCLKPNHAKKKINFNFIHTFFRLEACLTPHHRRSST